MDRATGAEESRKDLLGVMSRVIVGVRNKGSHSCHAQNLQERVPKCAGKECFKHPRENWGKKDNDTWPFWKSFYTDKVGG